MAVEINYIRQLKYLQPYFTCITMIAGLFSMIVAYKFYRTKMRQIHSYFMDKDTPFRISNDNQGLLFMRLLLVFVPRLSKSLLFNKAKINLWSILTSRYFPDEKFTFERYPLNNGRGINLSDDPIVFYACHNPAIEEDALAIRQHIKKRARCGFADRGQSTVQTMDEPLGILICLDKTEVFFFMD